MMEKHFVGYWDDLGITKQEFNGPGQFGDAFNMTVLALRMSGWRNGVSSSSWPGDPPDVAGRMAGHSGGPDPDHFGH